MRGIFAIARRELNTYFASPIAYIVAAGMLALLGYTFSGLVFVSKEATLRPLFSEATVVLIFVAPLLTMRLVADEFRSGTIELLLTSPIRDGQVVVGKFLASLVLFAIMLVPTLYYVVVLKVFGNPDLGAMLALYLGLLLFGGTLLSLGTFASTLSSNQVVAGVLGVGIALALWLLPALAPFVDEPLKGLVRYAGLSTHFGDFAKGVVDTKDVVFYASVLVGGLFLATRVLETQERHPMRRVVERIATYLAYAGVLGMLASVPIWLITRRFSLWAEIPLAVGSVLVAGFILLRPAAVRQALTGRPAGRGADVVLVSLVFVALLVLANFLANRHSARADLTVERTNSLSPQTVRVLRALKEPVKLTGFFVADEPAQAQVQTRLSDLLDEYQFFSNKVSYEFVDPALKPALANQYGITRAGTLVLELGQKRQEAFADDEQSLTAAILKVSKDTPKAVYFLTGHAERDPGSLAEDGYARLAEEMAREGYQVETLDLSAGGATWPADIAALIVAAPQAGLSATERSRVADYLAQGGEVMLLCDPGRAIVDADMLERWGLRVRDDLVIDRPNTLFGDVASPMVMRYPWHPITRALGGMTTFFPYVRSLEIVAPAPRNLRLLPLVETSKDSWGESKLSAGEQLEFDAEEDTAGPLVIAAAVEDTVRGGRMVVFGNSLFVANSVLSSVHGAFGNSELFVSAMNWLTEDAELRAIDPQSPTARRVNLTRPQMNMVLYSSAVLLPLAILAVGFATWWANR